MAKLPSIPSRATLIKLQVKPAVTGDGTNAITALVKKIDDLGDGAYSTVDEHNPKNIFQLGELATKLQSEIKAYTAKNQKSHPKFCQSLSKEYDAELREAIDLAHDMRNVPKRMGEFYSAATLGLSHTANASEHELDRNGYKKIVSMLVSSIQGCDKLEALCREVGDQIGAKNFKQLESTVGKIRTACDAMILHAESKIDAPGNDITEKDAKLAAVSKKAYAEMVKARSLVA